MYFDITDYVLHLSNWIGEVRHLLLLLHPCLRGLFIQMIKPAVPLVSRGCVVRACSSKSSDGE